MFNHTKPACGEILILVQSKEVRLKTIVKFPLHEPYI